MRSTTKNREAPISRRGSGNACFRLTGRFTDWNSNAAGRRTALRVRRSAVLSGVIFLALCAAQAHAQNCRQPGSASCPQLCGPPQNVSSDAQQKCIANCQALPICGGDSVGASSSPQLRMRWQDFVAGPQGAQRLRSFQAGISKMRSLDTSTNQADYRRSWQYWANIHGYYGPQSPDGTVEAQLQYLTSINLGSYASSYQGIKDQTPPDNVAQNVWATCLHSGNTQADQAVNFFAWHRMYLYYFERVLRWAANDSTLRLPYWDYTNRGQTALPREFRLVSSTLYDSRRSPSLNNGSATLNPDSTNVNSYLTSSLYSKYFDYEYAIEENLHGYVHCAVAPPSTCPVAHMGDVPVAANDPIFYMHHANIDRLWACWQHLHLNPSGAWQTDRYQFVDETGTPQSKKVSEVLDTGELGYAYDNVAQCVATSGTSPSIATSATPLQEQAARLPNVVTSVANVRVTTAKTAVDLQLSRSSAPQLFSKPTSIELVLVDLTAKSPPGVSFDVYIAKKDSPEKREFVGTISWFGVFRHHGSNEPIKRTLSYDVTDAVQKLGGTAETAALTVVVEATTGLAPVSSSGADVMRAEAAKSFRSQASVEIRSIELRQSGQPQGAT